MLWWATAGRCSPTLRASLTRGQQADTVLAMVLTHRPETLAAGLAAFGVRSGSTVAVMAIGEAAALAHRAITVAGCESLTVPPDAMGVRLSLRLRGVLAVLAAGAEQTRAIGRVAGDLTELGYLWRLDAGGLDELAAAAAGRLPLAVD